MKEWEWDDQVYRRGSTGPRVALIQEWLSLRGFSVVVDGDYGPATERAVRQFQNNHSLSNDGIVSQGAFMELVMPIVRATHKLPRAVTPGSMVASYAEQHAKEQPREVGGENKGPWVRLYLEGLAPEGSPWCAGFVSSVLRQAYDTMNFSLPLRPSASCGALVASAKEARRFIQGTGVADPEAVRPGCLFLVRGGPTGWKHIGIVIQPDEEVFLTVEGNTNDEGSSEGFEVCRRVRSYKDKDYISI